MEIRSLQAHDNDSYSALWATALKEQDAFFRISCKDEPLPLIPTQFTAESFTLGAFVDSRLIGTVSLERDGRTKLKHKALLFRMFVHPDVAGQGIGKALLTEAIAQAEIVTGLRQIYLTVLARNERAKNLYDSLGFQIFAHEAEAVNFEGVFVDEYQMVYFLKIRNDLKQMLPNS